MQTHVLVFRWFGLCLLGLLIFDGPVRAATLRVPQDHVSVQRAVDAASDGDVILVAAGTYGGINFLGKSVSVVGVAGPDVTFLAPAGNRTVVRFESGETHGAYLTGFSISTGAGDWGGAISCRGASPTIMGNRIAHNGAWFGGGGIACSAGASPRIEGNLFESNRAEFYQGYGGAIWCSDLSTRPVIRGNEFRENSSRRGAAIAVVRGAQPSILDNLFHGNKSLFGLEGIYAEDIQDELLIRGNCVIADRIGFSLRNCANVRLEKNTTRPGVFELSNCPNAILVGNSFLGEPIESRSSVLRSPGVVFVNNSLHNTRVELLASSVTAFNTIFWHASSPPIELDLGGTLSASYCVVQGGWPGTGNLDAHPLWVGGASGDSRLRIDSPCVDAGTLDVPELPDFDLDGQARVLPGRPEAEPRIDIGADEMAIEHAVRFGQVGAADPSLPLGEVLRVNGGAGDEMREVRIGPDDWLEVRLEAPAAGPNPAPYVLYAFEGVPTSDTVSRQPGGLGWMAFGTPFSRDAKNNLDCIWNNIGFPDRLGQGHRPSEPAPHLLFRMRAENVPPGSVFTLQGFMLDDESTASAPASVTNAVVVRVE